MISLRYYLLFLSLQSTATWAQTDSLIDARTVWTMDQRSDRDSKTELWDNVSYSIAKSPLEIGFLCVASERIIRLSIGDTILLLSIPRKVEQGNSSGVSPIASVRLVHDIGTEETLRLDDCVISASIFGEPYDRDALRQEHTYPWALEVVLDLRYTDPDELHVNLTGGAYGNATLIYTAASATPEIIIHE